MQEISLFIYLYFTNQTRTTPLDGGAHIWMSLISTCKIKFNPQRNNWHLNGAFYCTPSPVPVDENKLFQCPDGGEN